MKRDAIIEAVRDWLDDDDWNYKFVAEKNYIKMGINLKSKLREAQIYIDFKEDCYIVYVVAPISGNKDDLGELLRYVTMANYGLVDGNFEVDCRDGEIRYKSYVNCEGLPALSTEVIARSVCIGCSMMDRYGGGLAALALGFSDAATEIQKIEGKDAAETAD